MVHLSLNGHVEYPNFLTDEECDHIAHVLLRDEHKILSIPQTKETGYTGLTAQHTVYNLLTHQDIRPLDIPKRIFDLPIFQPDKDHWYDELWIQCWGNILHQGQNLPPHSHAPSSIDEECHLYACSIFLNGHYPSYTHWEDKGQHLNVTGTLHVAGMGHEHEVKTNVHTQPRISMAFDIYWNHDDTLSSLTKRFLHVRRPTHTSTDYNRRLLGKPLTPGDREGHGKIPATDRYGYNVGSKHWNPHQKSNVSTPKRY